MLAWILMTSFVTKKIGRRRSLGSILKIARNKLNLTLDEVEVKTKIRLHYLEALESGNYDQLPAEAYNIGFVRCYAEALKLNPEKIIRLYREERSRSRFSDSSQAPFPPRSLGDWHFLITPKVIGVVVSVLLLAGVIGYIGIQLKEFAKPPRLEITNVPTEFTTSNDKVNLEGISASGAVVSINAEPVYVDTDGKFSQEVQLAPGINEIIVLAKSRSGNETKRLIQVLFTPDLAKIPIVE